MPDAIISEMNWQDLNYINSKAPRWARMRKDGFKAWIPGGGWHYGFLSYEQAEWALGEELF